MWQAKNRDSLYDTLRTLADVMGEDLAHPQHIALLMPPLVVKWNETRDDDTGLFPLFEVRAAPAGLRQLPCRRASRNRWP